MSTTQNGNPWFASTIGLMGLIAGYVIATGVQTFNPAALGAVANIPSGGQVASQAAVPTPPATNDTPPTAGDGPSLGKADAPITLVEFTDFQCPFCQRHFQQTFDQIKKDYVDTGKVRYVTRYFPLSFHPNAEKAAEAAACANDQGKFYDMHAKLFTTQNDWSPQDAATAATTFKSYAKDIGLNTSTFASCFDGGTKAAMIQADTAAGSASGIDGTPGFWILGPDGKSQKISGAYPYATFQSAFDGMLN
jgi:protein-disulfide isomerase